MFTLILYQPEIPPNTGNIIRLCANTGTKLHLIEPLGFDLDAPRLKRAGLDYHEFAAIELHATLDECLRTLGHPRVYPLSTKARTCYATPQFVPGDAFLFGPETRGLPPEVLHTLPEGRWLRIPMQPANRSLNLSNAAAVVLYEAWRQQDFAGSGRNYC